jgi:hypothetical protein
MLLRSFVVAICSLSLFACTSNELVPQERSDLNAAKATKPKKKVPTCTQEDFLGGNLDSNAFQLSDQQVEGINSDDTGIELASAILSDLGSKMGCGVGARSLLKMDAQKSDCREVIPGKGSSEACFLLTNLGEFFVIYDYVGGATVVFNRFD